MNTKQAQPVPRLQALLPLLALDRLPRTGWLLAGIAQPETVAAHSHGTAVLTLVLGPQVRPALDLGRAASLAVVHDLPEALTTDLPRRAAELLPRGAKEAADEQATRQLATGLGAPIGELLEEYAAQESREAIFARLCDKLHLGLRLVGYLRSGARGLDDFYEGIVTLDCAGFEPCEALRRELTAELDRTGDPRP